MKHRLQSLRARFGDLWWYTALVFIAYRAADLINVFIGLWLVPRYVKPEELGAVLPLTQIGLMLGVPLNILLLPFSKYLNRYAAEGEWGKVKSLLRDVFLLTALVFLLILGVAWLVLPAIFLRMRVENGNLGLLIVVSGVVSVLLPVFTSALQALKRFNMISLNSIISAPLRLATMLIALPFRGLSGYFTGQIVPALYAICATCFSLRNLFSRSIPFEPYLRADFRPMLRYLAPVAVMICAATLQGSIETFVIRHRLPDFASAEFYMISRFAEIAAYVGATLMFVLFPLAAERQNENRYTTRLLRHSVLGTAASGFAVALLLWLLGDRLLSLTTEMSRYTGASGRMALLAATYTLRTCTGCFTSCETACGRFRFLHWWVPVILLETTLLYALGGYTFFYGILPNTWVDFMGSLNAARLDFVLGMMFAASLLHALAIIPALRRK